VTAPSFAPFVAPGPTGRTFRAERRARLGDVGPGGRLRLDAVARYLQDVANDDSTDAGLEDPLSWVVRRTAIDVHQPAIFNESLALTTWCAGTGAGWAERRTSLIGDRGARIEAAALWVAWDVGTGRPRRLSRQFFDIYGDAAQGRRIRARLTHPDPGGDEETSERPWPLRFTDFDLLRHVNNAAYWSILEEHLSGNAAIRSGPIRAELEHRQPIEFGDQVEVLPLVDAATGVVRLWLIVDADIRATFVAISEPPP